MEKIIKILKAISDNNRLRITCLIFHRSGLCVCEITEIIGLSQSTISTHLKKLQDAGLITYSKNGLWINYYINKDLEKIFLNFLSTLMIQLKNDKMIKEDLKKAEKVSRLEICKS
jgi:ArsR family transcriptional regulator